MSYRENFDHMLENLYSRTCGPADLTSTIGTMEAFHLLSRGGIKFDKQKYRDDVKLFNVSTTISILSSLIVRAPK
jgi:hypothetical protein